MVCTQGQFMFAKGVSSTSNDAVAISPVFRTLRSANTSPRRTAMGPKATKTLSQHKLSLTLTRGMDPHQVATLESALLLQTNEPSGLSEGERRHGRPSENY